MSAFISAWGRLVADPEIREAKNGNSWGTARLAVNASSYKEDGEQGTLWLNVVVFRKTLPELLARHKKGECLSVSGKLEKRPYTTRSGEEREGWTVVAESVIGPRSPRPNGGTRNANSRNGIPAGADRAHQEPLRPGGVPFDDGLPF